MSQQGAWVKSKTTV